MSQGPFRYFVLLADMRTGSNLFENMINQFDGMKCLGELFNPNYISKPVRGILTETSAQERDENPIAFIEKMIEMHPDHLIGFRLFSDHNQQVTEHCLSDPACAKIILKRNPMDSFVSLEIVKQTRQWLLRNLHVRKDAKVKFEIDAFQKFLEEKRAYQAFLDSEIHGRGQTAFRISYENMTNVDTFNGVAKFLGSDQELTKVQSKTKRQNPGTLQDKLTNYDEMRKQVRDLNIFEGDVDTYVEPSKTRGSVVVHAGRTIPIMYFPITHRKDDPIVDWMTSLETDGLPSQTKMKGGEIQDWLGSNQNRVVITALEHPVERAYHAFNARIVFLPSEKNMWIRRVLIEQFDLELPTWGEGVEPSLSDLKKHDYTPGKHAKNFIKFLKFVQGNLRGQTVAPVSQEWSSQYVHAESYHRWTVPNFAILPQDREWAFSIIEERHGLTTKDVKPKRKPKELIPLDTVYSKAIENTARAAYFQDYRKFGFQDWKPTD